MLHRACDNKPIMLTFICKLDIKVQGQKWWSTPVIPDTLEVEVGGSQPKGSLGKISTSSHLKNKQKTRGGWHDSSGRGTCLASTMLWVQSLIVKRERERNQLHKCATHADVQGPAPKRALNWLLCSAIVCPIFISIYSLFREDPLWQFWIVLHCKLVRLPSLWPPQPPSHPT